MRMASPEIIKGLRNCELFALLTPEEIEVLTTSLANACEMKTYQAGEHIFEQGERSAKLHIITDGQVLVERSLNIGDRSAPWPLGLLGKGSALGLSALVSGIRYFSASAICQESTQAISIESAGLRSALEKHPAMGFRVMDRLAYILGERLQAAYNTMEAHL